MNKSRAIKKFTLILLFAFSFLTAASLSSCAAESEMNTAKDLRVEIVSLKEGERVHGEISIEAHVNYPEAVKYCEFYIQELGAKDRYGWKDYNSPYFWGGDGQMFDTTLFDDGVASAVAFCYPKDSQSAMVQNRVRFVIDNGKPKVKIVSMEDKSIINGKTLIKVESSDSKGITSNPGVTSIYIYIDGGFYKKLTNPPFEVLMETCMCRPGLHQIRVVAEDSEGLNNADVIMVSFNPDVSVFVMEKTIKK